MTEDQLAREMQDHVTKINIEARKRRDADQRRKELAMRANAERHYKIKHHNKINKSRVDAYVSAQQAKLSLIIAEMSILLDDASIITNNKRHSFDCARDKTCKCRELDYLHAVRDVRFTTRVQDLQRMITAAKSSHDLETVLSRMSDADKIIVRKMIMINEHTEAIRRAMTR